MEPHEAYDEPGIGIQQIVVKVLPDGRMSRATAARYIGVSAQTLAIWSLKKIGPPPLRIGGRCYYRLSEVDAFIAAGGA